MSLYLAAHVVVWVAVFARARVNARRARDQRRPLERMLDGQVPRTGCAKCWREPGLYWVRQDGSRWMVAEVSNEYGDFHVPDMGAFYTPGQQIGFEWSRWTGAPTGRNQAIQAPEFATIDAEPRVCEVSEDVWRGMSRGSYFFGYTGLPRTDLPWWR